MKFLASVLFGIGLLQSSTIALAQVNFAATWDFQGAGTVDLSSTQLADTSGYNVVLSPAVVSSAWHSTTLGSSQAVSFDAYNPGEYVEFTIDVDAGATLLIDTISFTQTSAGPGAATDWEIRSDADGYATVLRTGTTSSSGTGSVETENGLGLASAGNSLTFRILGTGGGGDQFAGFAVANVYVTGTAVPEPSGLASLGGLLVFLTLGLRRRR